MTELRSRARSNLTIGRREFLAGTMGAALSAAGGFAASAAVRPPVALRPSAGTISLAAAGKLDIAAWTYNGSSPGQTLRVKQGEDLAVRLHNSLAEETTIHWHGVRTPGSMDGVPYITQPPIKPGAEHSYRFACADAGTYWYHPHANSQGQLGRGLYGPIIVEEEKPIAVDRDLVWMLADWRIGKDRQAMEDFGQLHESSHAGRLGNAVTVNGELETVLRVRPGERLRLRLINAATARIFAPEFSGLSGWIVAFDGQPVEPRSIGNGKNYIAPGNRVDLILDIPADAPVDAKFAIEDQTYRDRFFTIAVIAVAGNAVRTKALGKPAKLQANPLGTPNLPGAETKSVVFEGGAMGRMRTASLDGEPLPLRELAQAGAVWATNGQIFSSLKTLHDGERLFKLDLGKSYIFKLQNRTAFPHPIHLHGHTFQVLSRQGAPLAEQIWRDTVFVFPNETVEIAFVADNPGDWLLHCHILGHAASGMIAAIQVG